MKYKLCVLFLSISIFTGCQRNRNIESQEISSKLQQLVAVDDFFGLKSQYEQNKEKLSADYQLFYGALVDNYFNNPTSSNEKIEKLLTKVNETLSDTLMHQLYHMKLMNDINLCEYSEAVNASEEILKNYKHLIDSSKYEELQNDHKVWLALANAPKQEIIRTADCNIHLERDKVGLLNIPTVFKKDSVNFLFDTGANFSVITRSVAEKLNMNIIEADFYVTASTGSRVESDIAIADEFQIGSLTIKNAVFLIFEDKDLAFPQADYYPNGAIGFPVIRAFGELQFEKDNNIFVPQHLTDYKLSNLALDDLFPVIAVLYGNDTLQFTFDTGANATSLYSAFYNRYQTFLDKNYTKRKFKSGGAGGMVEFEGMTLDTLTLGVADSKVILDSVNLHIEDHGEDNTYVYGNFGQDYIKKFDKMIISFESSSILFE